MVGMLKSCINLVAGLGIFGVVLGIMGDVKLLFAGVAFVASALISAAIVSLKEK
jgi:hypothetical protein